jgi:hypothetical protein
MPAMTSTRMLITAAAALSVAATASAPAAQAAPGKCKARQSATLASSQQVRVFAKNDVAKVCYKRTGGRFSLDDAQPTEDVFTAAGRFVAYSSSDYEDAMTPMHSIVNVIQVPSRRIPQFLPQRTNAHVDAIVVKRNGAAAWATTSSDGITTAVQGTDRLGHAPDDLSDDTRVVATTSLTSGPGGEVDWDYTDGTSDSAMLFTEPAPVF